jgi:hypothetical protein
MRHAKTKDYQAAVEELIVRQNQGDDDAWKWLSAFLKRLDWSSLQNPSLWGFHSDKPSTLPARTQIALLKACIDLMVRLREQRKSDACSERGNDLHINFDIGGVVYGIANDLFRRPLPFSERDICDILGAMRHDCGHGGDVTPPFDVALAYARKHQLSNKLLTALKLYVDRMKGLRSIIANGVKRKAQLLLTLDASCGKKRCWSERFRAGLSTLPESEQKGWRAMVVRMDAVEFGRNQKDWKTKAPKIIETLGAKEILKCLSAWWPDPAETPACPLETGGSYLLQHFVWLLGVLAREKQHAKTCDRLIVQLSHLDWKPKERGQKVMVAATQYLEQRPPALAWLALQRLAAWSESVNKKEGYTGSSVSKSLKSYAEKHGLSPSIESV